MITLTLGFVLTIDSADKFTVVKLFIINIIDILIDAIEVLLQYSFKGLKKIIGFLINLPL